MWSNLIGVGTPYLQYYGFLYFYFAGAIDLILRDIHLTTKLSLWLGHMVSAATMYLFARQLMNSRPAAFMAALAYVASFWHTQQVLLMGRYPLSLFYALLPVPFWAQGPVDGQGKRGMHPPGWLETNVVQFTDPDHLWYDPTGRTFHLWMRAHTGGTHSPV